MYKRYLVQTNGTEILNDTIVQVSLFEGFLAVVAVQVCNV